MRPERTNSPDLDVTMVQEVWADAAASRSDDAVPTARATVRGLSFGLDRASQASTTMLTAVLMWTGIGWLLDRWLGTGPWLLAIGALAGNAAGVYLLYVTAQRMADDADTSEQPTDTDVGAHDTTPPLVTKGPTR